ncbi:hypothetical protein [Kitasatospora sp. NPDC051705]|uniref:hypothetical protein n=1 Tax=Kitasatospora sp. NPDC051705 TaxID=3364057 RepID=UPI0037910F73
MTETECGSCSYRGKDCDELRQHWEEAGHSPLREKTAEQPRGRGRKVRIAAVAGLGLAAAVAGALALKKANEKAELAREKAELVREKAELVRENAELAEERDELQTWACSLVAQLAEALVRIDYLESSTGAGKTLHSYRQH